MAGDARISTALPMHPKTRKLRKRLGVDGCWSLICLFLWAADNKSDGDLSGMSDEDIEIAADWLGAEGMFVQTLREVVFLEGDADKCWIHDWAQHNPYAMAHGQRVEVAKRAALARWQPKKYAERIRSGCGMDAGGMRVNESSNAPNPTQPSQEKTSSSDVLDISDMNPSEASRIVLEGMALAGRNMMWLATDCVTKMAAAEQITPAEAAEQIVARWAKYEANTREFKLGKTKWLETGKYLVCDDAYCNGMKPTPPGQSFAERNR